MLLLLLDTELRMALITGLLRIHGDTTGEKTDSSELELTTEKDQLDIAEFTCTHHTQLFDSYIFLLRKH